MIQICCIGNSCMLGTILHAFLSSADFVQNKYFQEILTGIPTECKTVWIQTQAHKMSGLIWVQNVFEGYQQTTLVGKDKQP